MGDDTIGQRIRAARVRAGLSQRRLGERLGKPREAVGRWEAGMGPGPRAEHLADLAAALGVTVEYLVGAP